MTKTLVEILEKTQARKKKYFENYLDYCRKIKEEAEKFLSPVKVLVFGSIVQGNWGPNSDIDVLVISDKLSKNWEENTVYKARLRSKLGLFSPFQIHLVRFQEYESWYKNFIKEDYIEIK